MTTMSYQKNLSTHFPILLFFTFLMFNVFTINAQTKSDVKKWKQLFNGKDLTG